MLRWVAPLPVKVKVAQPCPTLCDPMDGLHSHGILQARICEWVVFPFSRGSFQPRGQTQVSCIAGGFFTSWPQGKPKNTGVGSLSLLQLIFLTQELNQGLLHCRRILHQPSGNPPPHSQSLIKYSSVLCPLTFQKQDQCHRVDRLNIYSPWGDPGLFYFSRNISPLSL